MDKSVLIEKIKAGNFTPQQLLGWVHALPGSSATRKPVKNKVGDVYMHPIFQHPYVLLENKKTHWVCGLITSESKCPEILEPTQSRFFDQAFFTKTIFTASEIQGSWINTYDNTTHLKSILIQLKKIFK
jgi:hypothetical protein